MATTMNALKRMFWRMQYEKSKRIAFERIPVFAGPEGEAGLHQFDSYLTEKTNTRLEPLYRLRLQEIDQILHRYDVKSVREMGSGRTTYFFNLYSGLDVVSYEQDERWRDVLLSFYKASDLSPPRIVCSDVERYKNGGRFVSLQDTKCDLLYIDGPYVDRSSGKLATHTGKPVYYDFERVLETNLPKVIMVEGRTDTVDELLRSPYAANYDFCGELIWALERNRYLHALRLSHHSIFVRKP
jgi:hypothetical protein